MSIITNPVLSVTAFEGTSLERTLTAPIDVTQEDALKFAVAECHAQAKAIEESAGVELHIAALEKAQGKKLTKPQRELVTLSYNISNGVEEEEPTNDAPVEKEEEQEEPTPEEPSTETVTEGTEGSTEPSGVDEPQPEPSEDPVADAVEELAEESGIDSDAATDAALAELGL